MTEEQIEIRVEKAVDALDARLMGGEVSEEEYQEQMRKIDAWAEQQWKKKGATP